MSWLSVVQYNFCRAHSSVQLKDESRIHHRMPAIAAGLTHRTWATRDWLLTLVLGEQRSSQENDRINISIENFN